MFTRTKAIEALFDALTIAKCTSFGMTFTMSLLYTMLVYYSDLDWPVQYGVDKGEHGGQRTERTFSRP
ncbi:hypothetical protein V8B97DRAFT_1943602 [Scleroderma yunnanense]